MTPSTSHSGIVSVQYPINLGYIVSYLRENNIVCIMQDFEVQDFSENDFLKSIEKARPRLVGFSCMTPHIKSGAKLAKLIKNNFPDILTVVGGVHASAIPEQTLREFSQFDVVVYGEGEQTLADLYRGWCDHKNIDQVLSIAYRQQNGSSIKVNAPRPMIENLDDIPFPDRDLVNIEKYKVSHISRGFSRKTLDIAEIICSRGCPYDCIFCASKVIHSRRVRFRSPENIIAEMAYLIDNYDIDHFSFLDDVFTLRKNLLKPVCEYMGKRRVTFDCYARVDQIDEEKIDIMIAGGCKKISFGIESGSPKILKLLKKGITIEQVEHASAISKKAKLHTIEMTFMIGCHPDETLEDIEMTKNLIYRFNPDIMGIFISIPYPGTELNRILKERCLLLEEHWDEFVLFFGNPSWELENVSMEELKRILRRIMYGYYLRPSYIWSRVSKLSLKELKYWFSLGFSFVKTRLIQWG